MQTTTNLHAPERQTGESMPQYKQRRLMSKRAAEAQMRAVRVLALRDLGNKPLSKVDRKRQRVRAERPVAIEPKPLRERTRKPHHHPMRDEDGAYTLVGAPIHYEQWVETDDPDTSSYQQRVTRRKWLAGISAQRGY